VNENYFDVLVALHEYERTGDVGQLREALRERNLTPAIRQVLGDFFVAMVLEPPRRLPRRKKELWQTIPAFRADLTRVYRDQLEAAKEMRRRDRAGLSASDYAADKVAKQYGLTRSSVLRAKSSPRV
jgi:hypothetical protein